MKIKRAVKTALAVVLSATIALGLIGGIAPVKSFAATALDYTLSPGQSITITVDSAVNGNDHDFSDTSLWGDPGYSRVVLGAIDGATRTVTISVGNNEPAGVKTISLRDNSTDPVTTLYIIHVTVPGPGGGAADPNPDSNPGDKPSNNGEDPALRTLPPTGPDGHQHDWHWEYGSTYHCSICNTFYTVYPAHDHQYEWYVTKAATETDDGEAHHMCKICGSVDLIEPVGAYYLFSQNAENKINKAPIGGTVNVETTRWLSFQGYVLDALAKRPDVTLNVTFRENGYKGGDMKTVTIPAGYDAASLKDANGYCGFKYLAGVFGAN